MLTIHLMKSADYYLDAVGADYYLKGGEPPGEWFGRGAKFLGLSNVVKPEHFRKLFKGYHPTKDDPDQPDGVKLVTNAGDANRQAGWDLTFSAPKSVSVLWALSDKETRNIISDCVMDAVKETLQHMEDTIAYSRTGAGGRGERKKVDLTIALFPHHTSRAGDPLLHTHCPVMNVGIDASKESRTIVSRLLYQHKMTGGAFCRSAIAANMEERLSVRFQRNRDSCDIAGVPEWLMDLFSKRRKEVVDELAKRGLSGAKAAAMAALTTRDAKDEVLPQQELLAKWKNEAETARVKGGYQRFRASSVLGKKVRDNPKLLPQAMELALENLTRNKAHFSHEDLFREALLVGPEFGLRPKQLLDATHELVAGDKRIVRLDSFVGQRYTTLANLEQESKLLKLASQLSKQRGTKLRKKTVQTVDRRHSTPDVDGQCLSDEQRKAFLQLVESSSGLRFLHGLAGTGKTSFVLRACIEAWSADGYDVVGVAPTNVAAEVLAEDTGVPCKTINLFLGDYEVGGVWDDVKHHARQLGRAALGKKTWRKHKPEPDPLPRKPVVIVDEAGMVNLRHFLMLMEHAKKHNATIVFLGDPNQLPPVEGTAPFNSLSRRCGHAQLTDIQRQKQQWARDASQHMCQGEAGKALQLFAKHGRLTVGENKEDAVEKMVHAWASRGVHAPDKSLIICSTNRDVDTSNELCQQRRLKRRRLDANRPVKIYDERKEGVHTALVYPNDRVVFTATDKKLGVKNGYRGTVQATDVNRISVKLDNNEDVFIPTEKFKHIRLGYAVTTHKSQGSTVDYSYMLAGGSMQDLPMSYVQATRAKEDAHFFTTKDLVAPYIDDVEEALMEAALEGEFAERCSAYRETDGVAESRLAAMMSSRPDLSLASDFIRKPHLQGTSRSDVISQITADYLAQCESGQNECIIAPTPIHAEGLNHRCHYELARKNDVQVQSANRRMLVVGDRVIVGDHRAHLIPPNRRATVVEVTPGDKDHGNEAFVRLRFDERSRLRPDEDTLTISAKELNVEYAHALTVEQANSLLKNCPQPFFLQDSPPVLNDFLDWSTEQPNSQQNSWQKWLDDVRDSFGQQVGNLIQLYRDWDERVRSGQAAKMEEWAREMDLLYRYRRELAEEQASEQQPKPQTREHDWTQPWMNNPYQPTTVGLSPQVHTATTYGNQPQANYTAPTSSSTFDRTYSVVEAQAAMKQAQDRIQEIQATQQIVQDTYVQSMSQQQTQQIQQQSIWRSS